MCNRYNSITGKHLQYDFSSVWANPTTGDVAPTLYPGYTGLVVRLRDGARGLDAMRWGLVPSWDRDPDLKKYRNTNNARAERIESAPMWRGPFRRSRCLAPASSFVEWTADETGKKIPHLVSMADESPIVFAGIWDRCRIGDDELLSYSIVTTDAHPGLRWLHHRIPVLLSPAEIDLWMDPNASVADLRSLLSSPEPDMLKIVPA